MCRLAQFRGFLSRESDSRSDCSMRAMDYIITILCLYIKWCRVFYGGLGHIIIREIDAASVGGIIVIKTYHHFVLWHRHTHTKTRRNKISLCHTISLERVTSYNLLQGCRVEICIPMLRVWKRTSFAAIKFATERQSAFYGGFALHVGAINRKGCQILVPIVCLPRDLPHLTRRTRQLSDNDEPTEKQ